MTIAQRREFLVVITTLAAIISYLATTDTILTMVTVVVAFSLWGMARLDLPEYAQYALGLILLIPAVATSQLVQNGMLYALLAVPALVRAALLVSFHQCILYSVKLIISDARGKADH